MDVGRKVYVGNLEPGMTPETLQNMFTKYGAIAAVWVARNPPGFAFVTFEDARDADDAVQALDGTKVNSKHIRVEIARGPRNPNKVPADYKVRGDGYSRHGDERRSPSYGTKGDNHYRRSRSRSRDRRDDYGNAQYGRQYDYRDYRTSSPRGDHKASYRSSRQK